MNYLHYVEALSQFNCGFEITTSNELIWLGQNPPTDEQVNSAIQAEPMRLLRLERNRKLAQTDWRASSDLTLSSEWSTYRQALRDLPANSTPSLDSDGNLQNVTWPSEPS